VRDLDRPSRIDEDTVNQSAPLTTSEQVTLRRVAHGLCEADFVRRQDIDRLRALALIDTSKRMPRLTGNGKRRYESLSLAVAVVHRAAEPPWLACGDKRLERRPRR
jgi:hypothetical protein